MYEYFISYRNGDSIGNCSMDINHKINSLDNIRHLESELCKNSGGVLAHIITNYILLSGPDELKQDK